MDLTILDWKIHLSWTPQLISVEENDIENETNESVNESNENKYEAVEIISGQSNIKITTPLKVAEWLDFSTTVDDDENIRDEFLQLQKTSDECSLTISQTTQMQKPIHFWKINIVSEARRVELSSKHEGYIGTVTGDIIDDGIYSITIKDVKAVDLTVKLVSFKNKCFLNIARLRIRVSSPIDNGSTVYRSPGSNAQGRKIDMDDVNRLLENLGYPISENARKFMETVQHLGQNDMQQQACGFDMSSMMAIMASIAPNTVQNRVNTCALASIPLSSSSDSCPPKSHMNMTDRDYVSSKKEMTNRHTEDSTVKLDDKVNDLMDSKLDELEEKIMEKVDNRVSAMESRIMGKFDQLFSALDRREPDNPSERHVNQDSATLPSKDVDQGQ